MVGLLGIEPRLPGLESGRLPLSYNRFFKHTQTWTFALDWACYNPPVAWQAIGLKREPSPSAYSVGDDVVERGMRAVDTIKRVDEARDGSSRKHQVMMRWLRGMSKRAWSSGLNGWRDRARPSPASESHLACCHGS